MTLLSIEDSLEYDPPVPEQVHATTDNITLSNKWRLLLTPQIDEDVIQEEDPLNSVVNFEGTDEDADGNGTIIEEQTQTEVTASRKKRSNANSGLAYETRDMLNITDGGKRESFSHSSQRTVKVTIRGKIR